MKTIGNKATNVVGSSKLVLKSRTRVYNGKPQTEFTGAIALQDGTMILVSVSQGADGKVVYQVPNQVERGTSNPLEVIYVRVTHMKQGGRYVGTGR
jgi:hypothetical protein